MDWRRDKGIVRWVKNVKRTFVSFPLVLKSVDETNEISIDVTTQQRFEI